MPVSDIRASGLLQAVTARIRTRISGPTPPAGERIQLAAMRSTLDARSVLAKWSMNPDGVLGRSLMMPAGAAVTFPLKLSGDVWLTSRAMLLPHEWRDHLGGLRATVTVTDRDGGSHELWSGSLRTADRGGRPRGLHVNCRVPASSTSLQLGIRRGDAPAETETDTDVVTRAIWREPVITDPNFTPEPSTPAPSPAPPTSRAPDSSNGPLVSVLTPVHDPPLHMLEEAIASVQAQTFTNWELCLVDDGSTDPQVSAALQRHAASDPRIHLTRHDQAGGISAATNTALTMSTGRYIALLDHDDTLTPDALQHIADTITAQPDLDMIYTDEDIVDETGMIARHPKPAWSPEHMSALMYTCHLGIYRRDLALDLGGFESRFDGCQDYDFVLRLMERTDRIAHIPRILYHWRAHSTSTAGVGDQAKPYAYLTQPAAIADHLRRTGVDAEVQFAALPGIHRLVHRVDPATSIDLVLAVENEHGLTDAARSWLAQPHPTWNVVLAAPTHALDAATAALTTAGIPTARITTITTTPHDTPATSLATAARAATSEHLLLMQTPAAGLTHDWLTRLIGYSNQPGIAAAGPILLAPDGRIQQAGIAIPDGIPLHLRYGFRTDMAQPVVYNLSAVSGILATRRDTYHQLNGLDPELNDLTLIDYCLRATDHHHRIVIVPDARLRTTGPDPTTNDLPTIWKLRHTWNQTHTHDPYYNPQYRTDRGDFILHPLG